MNNEFLEGFEKVAFKSKVERRKAIDTIVKDSIESNKDTGSAKYYGQHLAGGAASGGAIGLLEGVSSYVNNKKQYNSAGMKLKDVLKRAGPFGVKAGLVGGLVLAGLSHATKDLIKNNRDIIENAPDEMIMEQLRKINNK